ncbi:MAG: flagellar protein FliT [Gammaproteobacteria bacterium]|nr:flagellar protein FliT [Gammaproteobacteria bacterium]
MQALQTQQLAELKKLTEQMLAEANAKNWQQLESHEKTRVKLIEDFFANKFTETDTPIIAPVIKSIIAINDQITLILETNKKKIQIEFSQFNSSKRAENAYLKNIG